MLPKRLLPELKTGEFFKILMDEFGVNNRRAEVEDFSVVFKDERGDPDEIYIPTPRGICAPLVIDRVIRRFGIKEDQFFDALDRVRASGFSGR